VGNTLRFLALGAVAIGLASSARAAIVDLTFEGVAASYPFSRTKINDFYNGGTSGAGMSGPDYGVTFSRGLNAACLNSLTVSACDGVSKGGLGPVDSQESALEFNSITPAFMDVAGGFTTELSLNYVTTLLTVRLAIWSGLDGAGDLLATLKLPANAVGCPDYDADFCPFTSAQVSFSGIARSVEFLGTAADFDDITFTAAPEPSTWAMMLIGFAGLWYATLRGKRVAQIA
jgi:hypothetical protein